MHEMIPSFGQLMLQASQAADEYLAAAIESVDKRLGEGAAKANPALLGAMIQAASHDYLAGIVTHYVAPALERIADSGDRIADAIDSARSE